MSLAYHLSGIFFYESSVCVQCVLRWFAGGFGQGGKNLYTK